MFNIKEIINKILNRSNDINQTEYTVPLSEDGKKQFPIYSPLKGKF